MIELTRYIPKSISDTEREFVLARAEAIESLIDSRNLNDGNAWITLQEQFKNNPDDEAVHQNMFLISAQMAFSEAEYLFSANLFPRRGYIDILNLALHAVEVAVQTYAPEFTTYKHHVEQCLREVMRELPQEAIDEK